MKDIMLRITGKQINNQSTEDDGGVEFVTQARMYRKGAATVVLYDETELTTGVKDGVRAMLRITDDGGVRLKRYLSGGRGNSTIMEFHEGRRYESFYHTPFGVLPLEILTNSVENNIDTVSGLGSLSIDYEMALKGMVDGRSNLSIEISDVPEGFEKTKNGIFPGVSEYVGYVPVS